MPTAFLPPRDRAHANLFGQEDLAAQRAFFASRPELTATPLHFQPALAGRLGVGALWIKDESGRYGLNAFKSTGALFAIATLVARGEVGPGDTLVCASEGNHGRAVARAAREMHCRARVYMSHSVARARVDAIASEGADVVLVEGTYDDAVREMARQAETHGWVIISDTSWAGYAEVPRLIMLGYTRIMDEIDAALSAAPHAPGELSPDAIFVPAGVGGLLAAVACWCDLRYGAARPAIIAVEPASAACVQASARAGTPTSLAGPFVTTMGGLRCGEMSPMVFPAVMSLVDAFVAIEDEFAFDAMRLLARPTATDTPVACGPSGAAALGGLLASLGDPGLAIVRDHLRLGPTSRVVVLVTEGVTDPDLFENTLART